MSDIIQGLTSQLGIGADQAEAGAGAVMNLIKAHAPAGDFQQLLGAVPEASQWITKAQTALSGGGAGGGGGLLGQAAGLLGGAGGGLAGAVAALSQVGISADLAAKLLPQLLTLIKGKAGDALVGKLVGAVPGLGEAMSGGGSGAGGIMGKLLG